MGRWCFYCKLCKLWFDEEDVDGNKCPECDMPLISEGGGICESGGKIHYVVREPRICHDDYACDGRDGGADSESE